MAMRIFWHRQVINSQTFLHSNQTHINVDYFHLQPLLLPSFSITAQCRTTNTRWRTVKEKVFQFLKQNLHWIFSAADYQMLTLNNPSSNNNSISSNSPNNCGLSSTTMNSKSKQFFHNFKVEVSNSSTFFQSDVAEDHLNNTQKSSSVGSASPNNLIENDGN